MALQNLFSLLIHYWLVFSYIKFISIRASGNSWQKPLSEFSSLINIRVLYIEKERGKRERERERNFLLIHYKYN
jgi:hypothetical protein